MAKKRALIIGSQIGGLTGVESDTGRVREALSARGFDTDLRTAKNATRAGILDGYRSLIEADVEAAVIYYSGHGHYAINVGGAVNEPRRFQGISPTDYYDGKENDYRGISSYELSIQLARLTQRTKNVTVILDCCHSAQMSRDAAVRDAVPRALPHPLMLGLAPHLAKLRELYPGEIEQLSTLGNPDAVRMVACGQEESAFEYTNKQGLRTGAFTEALLDILSELGDSILTWGMLAHAVRERVLRAFPSQRPEVEGPLRRQLFSMSEGAPDALDGTGLIPVRSLAPDRVQLGAGRLHGVSAGDVYAVMPLGANEVQLETAIALASVAEPSATSAVAVIDFKNGHSTIAADTIAIPYKIAPVKRAVRLVAQEPALAVLTKQIEATRTLRIATDTDVDEPIATLRLTDDDLTIEDNQGPLFPATKYPSQLEPTVKNVANLGVAQALRELEGEHGLSEQRALTIELGVVESGKLRTLPAHGASLGLGNRLFVRLAHDRAMQQPLYAHIFNVGVRGKVSLLTGPGGIRLTRGDQYFLGANEATGEVVGLELFWPEGLPVDSFPRTDQVLVIVTTKPTDLSGLQTTEHVTRGIRDAGSRLQDLLSQLQDGQTRDVGGPTKLDAFLMKRLSYKLHPRVGGIENGGFEIDENPHLQASTRSARAWLRPSEPAPAVAPNAVAIRLVELIVNRNRALFSADIRVDALVTTRSNKRDGAYRVVTLPFKRIRNGDRLSMDNALLFLGPVRDFVDICLWVSRDTEGSLQLAQLLAERANSAEFQDAAGALMLAAGVTAAPWVAAVGASAVLARLAYEVILEAAGSTIGLYRTSFLAHEHFGIGRHPAENLYRAQDFSFALRIEGVQPTS